MSVFCFLPFLFLIFFQILRPEVDADANADAGIIVEAPIHHAPGLRYIAGETPCSDLCDAVRVHVYDKLLPM